MKKLTIILTVLCFVTTQAQEIKYESSLEEAKRLSREQNKPLAILVTMQPPLSVTNYMQGLIDKAVVNKFNDNFINFKTDRADTISRTIIKEYQVTGFPGFIFVDSKGGLMFKDFGNWPPQRYLIMADRAIYASKQKSLIDYENEYKSGKGTLSFIKEYIIKRQQSGIPDNAALIEAYIDLLKISDLQNYNEVLFILKAGPLADSKAYRLAYTNRKIADSIYKTEPPAVRSLINNTIIANTMSDAIATKNLARATAAANFTRNTWTRDPREGNKNYQLKLLQYYKAIKDTAIYLRQAGNFYDQFYMNISADSLRRMDQKNIENARNNAMENAMTSVPQGGALQSFSFTYAVANYGMQLNNGAWSVYETGTRNMNYLAKAMLWSKRSIELSPITAAYHDTLAHLLYRLEFYSEAESTQLKAIELGKDEQRDIKTMEEDLVKIQKRTL